MILLISASQVARIIGMSFFIILHCVDGSVDKKAD
jgi:hypothetical protein